MKKVSVFTVLTCFLAGAAHFPCYAGNFFVKPDQPDDDRSKRVPPQPSRSGGQPLPKTDKLVVDDPSKRLVVQPKPGGQPSSGGIPSAHPKPNPSPSLPPFDPVVVEGGPHSAAALPPTLEEGVVLSAEQLAALLQRGQGMDGVLFSVRKNNSPPVPKIDSSPSMPPSSSPVPVLQAPSDPMAPTLLGVPHAHQPSIPSMAPAPYEPSHGSQASVSTSSGNHGETYEAGGGILFLPVEMKLFPKLDNPGQLALVPKVCALSFYNYLSELEASESKIRAKMMLLTPDNKDDILNLIRTYLERHGRKNAQIFAAQKIFEGLKKAIETPNERKITFKVAPVEGKPEVYFCLEVEGGVIIFGKVPGQEI